MMFGDCSCFLPCPILGSALLGAADDTDDDGGTSFLDSPPSPPEEDVETEVFTASEEKVEGTGGETDDDDSGGVGGACSGAPTFAAEESISHLLKETISIIKQSARLTSSDATIFPLSPFLFFRLYPNLTAVLYFPRFFFTLPKSQAQQPTSMKK